MIISVSSHSYRTNILLVILTLLFVFMGVSNTLAERSEVTVASTATLSYAAK